MSRFQRAIVEHGTHLDNAAQIAGPCRMSLRQGPPGKARRTPCDRVVQRVGRHREYAGQVIEFDMSGSDAEQDILDPANKATQALIGGEVMDDRLSLRQRYEGAL